MIASSGICERAATVVALLALLWVVGTLWVLGKFYGDLDKEDDAYSWTRVVRVTFKGHKLWMFEGWRGKTDSDLIWRHQVNETIQCMDSRLALIIPSFAHAFFGDRNEVWQRGVMIGRADEIADGWPEDNA